MLKVLKCVCVCVCEKPTCPARARGRCEGLQRASEATDGGNSWMGASSRSSMRGFLMFDSGLVRGVTLFLLIKVPGPLFTSCRVRNITFIIFFTTFLVVMNCHTQEWYRMWHWQKIPVYQALPLVCLCGCSAPPHSDTWTPLCTRRRPGWASALCGGDTSGRASHLEQPIQGKT